MKIPSPPVLSFQNAVPRHLVHRSSIAEVFVTDVLELAEGSYMVAAQWPRWHVFYGSAADTYDSALIAETLRQATILISHAELGVPLGTRFLLPNMGVTKIGAGKPDGLKPTDVTLSVRVSDKKSGTRGLTSFNVSADFQVEDRRIATASAGTKIVNEATYARLRNRGAVQNDVAPPAGLKEAHVGSSSPRNVALTESTTAGSWILRVDTTNPIYFDHALDHVPGALLIEAARQCIRVYTGDSTLDVSSFAAAFLKIVELEGPTKVSVASLKTDRDGLTSLLIEFRNSDQEILTLIEAVIARQRSEDRGGAPSLSCHGGSPKDTSESPRRSLEPARG